MIRLSILLALGLAVGCNQLLAQVMTEWVEARQPGEADKIALGYPVPIPVDTPLPFDGFRTYAGLHMRHQDLAAATPWVHPEEVGLTHYGRTIWAYRLGDDDLLTVDGLPEPATLTNGGIHAREWSTPEVVTGILELMATQEADNHFYDYLRDNVNMIVIPSLNIDGFMQTQRYPALNYMQTDPDDPEFSPRDGRMRRKNMLDADEDLYTTFDHLNGVDLNRNNNPFWSTNAGRSSPDPHSLVHHGQAPGSEPEIQALDFAAHLGPIGRLRLYTDVHSFSMVHFWGRNDNTRLAQQTQQVLSVFSDHHRSFPAGKWYYYFGRNFVPQNEGIGTTDEYFTHTYQVPSWTLETEPSNGQGYHAPLPGSGADYGGFGENGHDGFILPESEVTRVREQLAQSFAAVYYRQAGPPAVQAMRVIDPDTSAVVFEAEWDIVDDQSRSLFSQQYQPVQIGRDYDLWLSFNKPMRWRENGLVTHFPGREGSTGNIYTDLSINGTDMGSVFEPAAWLDSPGDAPNGYMHYEDDAFLMRFRLDDDQANRDLLAQGQQAVFEIFTRDMTDMATDSNPATVADWRDGAWSRYESTTGNESDYGGFDTTLSLEVTGQPVPPPFLLEAGMTSAWYDRARDGEGFLLEMLSDNRAVMWWFTYDDEGNQDWYLGVGEVRGNRIFFPDVYVASGGEFGPGFDPDKVTREIVGTASFTWTDCDHGHMSYKFGVKRGRMDLARITHLMGLECGKPVMQPDNELALLSGAWYDPTHDGEGWIIEVLEDGRAVVFWFSFDPQGNRRWFYSADEIQDGKLVFDEMITTSGAVFGPGFKPEDVVQDVWGSLVLDLDCHGGTATYDSVEEGFGSGVLNAERITHIGDFQCPD